MNHKSTVRSQVVVSILLVVVAGALLSYAGRALVVENGQPSDVAITLSGGADDVRLNRGIDLLRTGQVHELVLDEPTGVMFGRPRFEYAEEYVRRLPSELATHVKVCAFTDDSTRFELGEVWQCVEVAAPGAKKMLVVTSSFHSRRALSIAKRVHPQYTWTASPVPDPGHFGVQWWRKREWAKTCLTEWQKLLWWELFERWTV